MPNTPPSFPKTLERRVTDFGWVTWPSWTPDSAHILFSSRRDGAGILHVDPDGRNLRHRHPIIGPPEAADRPTISRRPGGYASLVFTLSAGATRLLRFSIAHPDEKPAELAASPRLQGCPRYSPNGKQLAFYSDRSGYQVSGSGSCAPVAIGSGTGAGTASSRHTAADALRGGGRCTPDMAFRRAAPAGRNRSIEICRYRDDRVHLTYVVFPIPTDKFLWNNGVKIASRLKSLSTLPFSASQRNV